METRNSMQAAERLAREDAAERAALRDRTGITITAVAICDCTNTELEQGGSCDQADCPGQEKS